MNGVQKHLERFVTQIHVAVYRGSGGLIGGWMLAPVLLLTTTGHRTGEPRTTPLNFFPEGDDFVVIASHGGAPRDPHWWTNLNAYPEAEVEVGIARYPVRAREVEGEERERLWRRVTAWMPMYAWYQTRTERRIPVVVLERR